MSQENVEIVRAAFVAEPQRALEFEEIYHPDAEMDFSDSPFADFMTTSGRRRGEGQIKEAFRDWYQAFGRAETDVHELIDAGDHVVVVFTYRNLGRSSGIELAWHMAGVFTFVEGKIARVLWLRTREDALRAAGVAD